MRVLVLGNSGSGKSTLARSLSHRHGLAHLDLDTIVWEPDIIAVPRDTDEILKSLLDFIEIHPAWVIEGCYGELVRVASAYSDELIFLNPGLQACLENNQRRPWEPSKYPSKSQQDAMLEQLQAWVTSYYTRDDAWSYKSHRDIFDHFDGVKREYQQRPSLGF